jgi:opacity protein-like surface antigen
MKYLGFVLLVLSSSTTTTALAETDTYIALNIGASIVDDSKFVGFTEATAGGLIITSNYDFGHTISAALGVSFSDGYRFEVEVANQINDLASMDPSLLVDTLTEDGTWVKKSYSGKYEGIDVTVSTLLANAYKDFYIVDKFWGYVSGGVGIAYNEMDSRSFTIKIEGRAPRYFNDGRDAETVLAWQLGTGLGYELTKEITLNVGYRYLATDDVDYNATITHEFGSHNVTAGIRYSF